MKAKRIFSLILVGIMSLTTACTRDNNSSQNSSNTSTSSTETSATTENTTASSPEDSTPEPIVGTKESTIMKLGENEIKALGRTFVSYDTLWLCMSGTGLEFTFTGDNLDITVIGDTTASGSNASTQARIGVYVDGKRIADEMINEAEKTISVVKGNGDKSVAVRIVKLSESANSVCGIKLPTLADGEKIEAVPEKERRIEFIGDSITCGYGVDDEVKEHHFSTETEDFTKTYAYKAAEKLDAEYSVFAASGYGIISGYSGNGSKVDAQTIPQYYEKLGFSYQSIKGETQPQNIDYNFTFQPDVILINLGTNDDTYVTKERSERTPEYREGYVAFLKQIRAKNPDSTIICSLGIMGGSLFKAIEDSVAEYTAETGDTNIHTLKFDQQNMDADGIAADWHPSEKTHEKASDKLVEKVKEIMNW